MTTSYRQLLKDNGFQGFLCAQFLGAFNDNVYKMIVSILAVSAAAGQPGGGKYLALAGAVFVLPFLLFAGYAGQLADRFSKTRVLQVTKAFEIVIMLLGVGALVSNRIEWLLVILFLLAAQANFFSPAKYGILPEMVGEAQLSRANGLLELSTFIAIVVGSSFGTLLHEHWKHEPVRMGLTLVALAVVGTLASLRMKKTSSGASTEPFHWNPIHEIIAGARSLRQRKTLALSVAGLSWFWFVGALFQMALLLAGKETLHVPEMHVGLLVTALAVGIGLGSVLAGRISGDRIELGLVPAGSAMMAAFTIALGVTHSYYVAILCLTCIGFAAGLFAVPLNAYLQDKANPEEKGRILTTNNFVNMIGVILASGVLWLMHDVLHLSASQVIFGLGIAMVMATLYIVRLAPDVSLRFALRIITSILFRVRFEGAERIPAKGGALIVANHVSFVDAMLIGSATPRLIRFLMWQPYFETRGLQTIFETLHTIPIDTTNPRNAIRQLRSAREEVLRGELTCIFPEGAITRNGQVQAFRRGYERIVEGTGAPIIPIHIDGLFGHPLSMKGGGLFRSWSLGLRPTVVVRVGEPITEPISAGDLRQSVVDQCEPETSTSTLAYRFIKAARANWARPALADSTGTQMTFGEALTGGLLMRNWVDQHCKDEWAVGILLPASVGGALANLGTTLSGRTAVNLNFTTGQEVMQAAIARCGIRTILTSRVFLKKARMQELPGMVFLEDVRAGFTGARKVRALLAARLGRIAPRVQAQDVAAIIFSSGSTGDPKGIQLSHANVLSNIDAIAQIFDVGRGDSMLGALPFFHSFGFTYTLWFPLLNHFGTVFHTNPMEGKTIGELAGKHRSTFLLSTPTFCATYVRQCTAEQFGTLRYVLVGAEKLRASAGDTFREKFGVTLLEGYGCTEMSPVVAVNAPDGNRPGSVGRPIPYARVRIVHPETFEPVPEGQSGLLLVNGPGRMLGYVNDPVRTASAIRNGWYNTGDLARMDEDGFLHILDRLARISKIGGEMVPHLKIEEAISAALGGRSCVVVGIPDEARGERLAVLHTGGDVNVPSLTQQLAASGMPTLWIPKREDFHEVDEIPMLGTGKLDLPRARAIAMQLKAFSAAN